MDQPVPFTEHGFQCPKCLAKYKGKGSKNKAALCSKNPIPNPLLTRGKKYITTLAMSDRVGVIITEAIPFPILNSNGNPIGHKLTYKAKIFAEYYILNTETKVWFRSEGDVVLTNEQSTQCEKWLDETQVK